MQQRYTEVFSDLFDGRPFVDGFRYQHRMVVARQFAFFGFIFSFPFLLAGILWADPIVTLLTLGPLTLYYFCYWKWSPTQHPLCSRIVFAIVAAVSLFLICSSLGREIGAQTLYFAAFCTVFMIHGPGEKMKGILSALILLISLVCLYLTDFSFLGPSIVKPQYQDLVKFLYSPAPYFIIGWEILLLERATSAFEKRINQNIKDLSHDAEELLRLQRHGRIGYWEVYPETGRMFWSDQVYDIYEIPHGYSKEMRNARSYYSPEAYDLLDEKIHQCAKEGKTYDVQVEMTTRKGKHRWVRCFGRREWESNGMKLSGFFQDVTQSKKASLEVERGRGQLQKITNNVPGVLYQYKVTASGESSLPFLAGRVKDLSGYSPEEYAEPGFVVANIVHPMDRENYFHSIDEALKNFSPWKWTGRLITKKGKVKWVRAVAIPKRPLDGSILFDGLMYDISEQKKLEQSVEEERKASLESSRMAALGQMAGGIAHELNNPLAIIDGYSVKIIRSLKEGDFSVKRTELMVDRIVATSGRIRSVVSGLRKISRDSSFDPTEAIGVAKIVEDTLSLCQEKFRNRGIRVVVSPIPQHWSWSCRPSEICQVLLNLLNNAYDAISNLKGDKWIRLSVTELDQDFVLSVTNSGESIPVSRHREIFSPFFTTKHDKRGAGLGLSISRKIVEKYGGQLGLNSNHPQTQFQLTLPKFLPKQSEKASS